MKVFSQAEKQAIASSAQRTATLINNSLKVARSSSDTGLKLSAVRQAQQYIQEIKQLKVCYSFLILFDL
ncbi:MAG TPA: hypothetical protein VJ508_08825, partial [Saprospiraceae bacterium]|nr:hypothetical protein [Saprospiraceae bacterium]